MTTISKATLHEGMEFRAETLSGHTVVMDAVDAVGGKDLGPRPAEMPLSAWQAAPAWTQSAFYGR